MSALSRFMFAAREILDEQDKQRLAPNPHQPPVFVRTNWLFVEIDEALAKSTEIAGQIKVARLNHDIALATNLSADLARVSRQTTQLCAWAEEQFQREQTS